MKVYESMCAVALELSKQGIEKGDVNKAQGFKFRGIDAVYNTLSPLLAKHQLLILPKVTNRDVVERVTKNGTALFYVTLTVDYTFVSAEDGSNHTVTVVGEAMDSGDKATNKAMSAAYKYACFQAFAIPTEGDNDADATTHVVEAQHKPLRGKDKELAQQYVRSMVDALEAQDGLALRELGDELKENDDLMTHVWAQLTTAQKSSIKSLIHAERDAA